MAERFKAAVLKTVDPKGPGVRIPLSPRRAGADQCKKCESCKLIDLQDFLFFEICRTMFFCNFSVHPVIKFRIYNLCPKLKEFGNLIQGYFPGRNKFPQYHYSSEQSLFFVDFFVNF